ncbi:MAG: ABC transporter permease [Actinobacteria bacterium]|jgi:cell division transport system permease protein|nr:ABC transporter permease [Actinomycetota bacterium]MCL5444473.1 ABC transporter permease [Actinomycetota bacterium]
MPVSADYVARETASNLWRNRLMTVAAVLTVAVSLSLVGAALLLKQGAAKAAVDWQRGTQVTVWMNPNAGQNEVNAVSLQLRQLSYVHQPCSYKNKQQNYNQAKQLLTPDEIQAVTVADMPTSFWCTPNQPQEARAVIAHFSGQAGVRNVTAPLQQIHTEEEVIHVLQWVFLLVAVVLLVSATVLILNTIRMAIFARRREVSVMKLVGATNWFIRVPFMSEGMVQGLVGSLVAAGVVYGLHLVFNHLGNPNNPQAVFTLMRMSGWEVVATDGVVVVLGVLIGTLGSAVAIRRFLDV